MNLSLKKTGLHLSKKGIKDIYRLKVMKTVFKLKETSNSVEQITVRAQIDSKHKEGRII